MCVCVCVCVGRVSAFKCFYCVSQVAVTITCSICAYNSCVLRF